MKFLLQSLRHSLQNIRRNKLVNFLCLGIIAFTLLVLGIFQFISFNLERYITRVTADIEAIFYIRDDASPTECRQLLQRVQENLVVREARLVGTEQAADRFRRDFPEFQSIMKEFPRSPFPASIEVKFRQDADVNTQIESFIRDMRKVPQLDSVQINVDWAKRIEMIKKFISVVGLFLSLILVFVSVFIIFNVIKLNILYRRDEITIFNLVGATRWFIRTPFLIEGGLLGLCGGLLAGLLLHLVLRLFPLYADSLIGIIRQVIDFTRIPFGMYVRLVAGGAVIGLFSSLLSLKRFLK